MVRMIGPVVVTFAGALVGVTMPSCERLTPSMTPRPSPRSPFKIEDVGQRTVQPKE